MSKKLLVLSLLFSSICLYGCGTQNNDSNNVCEDGTLCSDQIISEKSADETATKRATSEIESDIEGFEQDTDVVPVAQKLNGEPITVSGGDRDM